MRITLRSAMFFCVLATSQNQKCSSFKASNSFDRSRLFSEVTPYQFSNKVRSDVFRIVDKRGLKWVRNIGRKGLPQSNTSIGLPLKERLLIFLRRFATEVTSFGATLSLLQFIPLMKRLFVRTSYWSFICNNLLRWSFASIVLRLVLLHSDITTSNPSLSRGETDQWFLSGSKYFATSEKTSTPVPVIIRQVPGNGSCMFLAIAAGILYNESSSDGVKQHPSMSEVDKLSRKLRSQAVDILSDAIQNNLQLIVQENESICAVQLVELVANKYGLATDDYLKQMRKPGVWGGGPELIALANKGCNIVLLEKEENTTHLKVSTRFGPTSQNKNPIYILSANSNFPGTINERLHNHFLAVFPTSQLNL